MILFSILGDMIVILSHLKTNLLQRVGQAAVSWASPQKTYPGRTWSNFFKNPQWYWPWMNHWRWDISKFFENGELECHNVNPGLTKPYSDYEGENPPKVIFIPFEMGAPQLNNHGVY